VNDAELQKLIDGYLAGSAGPGETAQLDALVRADPEARRQLLAAAAMESHLRQMLAPAEPCVGGPHVRPTWRFATVGRWAAVLVVGLAGWGAAIVYAQRYHRAERALADANRQPADPQNTPGAQAPPSREVQAGGPEIIDTRGWVKLLPANEDFAQGVLIRAGTVIPADRKVWTCPWGGAGARLADGTVVSLDRSTVAAFTEANDTRQIDLRKGIVSVTRRPAAPACGRMVLKASAGVVTFDQAQVTLAVLGGQTIVEVAMGTAEFRRASDGKTVQLSAGQYAVIGAEREFAAVTGSLQWRIEAPTKAGGG